jgi:anion-transporting  ArsA/GET3 family ATPase
MTFDPSLRLKDTLGVGDAARDRIVAVDAKTPGGLYASLLDAKATFDRLVTTYAPDDAARARILDNRYYDHLAGGLAGILEYMAVERLYEVRSEGRFDRIVLDTPPTTQAIDFLEAPQRIVSFLDSGALKLAMKPWFDSSGRLGATRRIPGLGRGLEAWLDQLVGMDLLRDMAEFFRAFGPLFEGFRGRAEEVRRLLASPETLFVLVAGPDEARVADTLFFARRLREAGYHLGPIIVNRIHPAVSSEPGDRENPRRRGRAILAWQGDRDRRGVAALRELLPGTPMLTLPDLDREPVDLLGLEDVSRRL